MAVHVPAANDWNTVDRSSGSSTREIAGQRIHGTTGQKPLKVFESEELAMLRALPPWPYERVIWNQAKVHSDSHVEFQGGLYSVPRTLSSSALARRSSPPPSGRALELEPLRLVLKHSPGARLHSVPSGSWQPGQRPDERGGQR